MKGKDVSRGQEEGRTHLAIGHGEETVGEANHVGHCVLPRYSVGGREGKGGDYLGFMKICYYYAFRQRVEKKQP